MGGGRREEKGELKIEEGGGRREEIGGKREEEGGGRRREEGGGRSVLRFLVEEARQRLHSRFRFKHHLWGWEGGSIQGRKWARSRWSGQKSEGEGSKRGVKNVKNRT
jgi:hypothetical protein